jgi:hypothetical protein
MGDGVDKPARGLKSVGENLSRPSGLAHLSVVVQFGLFSTIVLPSAAPSREESAAFRPRSTFLTDEAGSE